MKCPNCHAENAPYRKFCSVCGENLVLVCKQCGYENLPDDKFCAHCGYNLITPSESSPEFAHNKTPDHLSESLVEKRRIYKNGGERKQVTVLFSDLSGYTAMAEKLDPEEVKAIMGRIFGQIALLVTKYEGFIEKYIGDAILALFGIPNAHEDDPVRAVTAAREIHELIEAMSRIYEERIGKPLAMHTGINTGLVVTGEINLHDGTHGVFGDTINVASRLSNLAGPGNILLAKTTYKRVGHSFACEPLGNLKIKGKKQPFEAYKLKGIIYSSQDQTREVYSELVNREKELNRLILQIIKAINGEGSIVSLIGEAGIGKSRLIAELKKNDAMKKATLLEGRALAIGRNLSFHPVIDIFRSWAAIREDDGEAESIAKLEKTIGSIYKEIDEAFPFIATLMGMKLTGKHAQRMKGIEGEALEKLILKSIRDLIVKATEQSPLVFILENIHWADTTTIEFLESLLRLATEHPILFINVCRPNFKETSDRLLATIRERYDSIHTEIFLAPLNRYESELLTKNLTKASLLPPAIEEQIVMRTEGNPLFIEEIFRSFIDEGIVVLEKGNFRVTHKIQWVIIPETVQDVLMARIDMLDEETKDALKVASVIGRCFLYKVFVEVAEDISDIDKKLRHLQRVQLIREQKRLGETEYLFNHGLIQETTYESILITKRRELHLKVAAAIEFLFKERLHNFYGILAYHYSQAENLEKAEEYLVKAGEEALKSSASSEAINYYQEGLRLYLAKYGDAADSDKLAMFEKNLSIAFFNKGQNANALEYFDKVLRRLGERRSKNRIVIALKLITDTLSLMKNLYLPSKRTKKDPDAKTQEFFDLHYKRSVVLVYVDNQRCFIEYLRALRRLNKFDITKIENSAGIWMSTSGLFSWTGISFKLSRKILDYMKGIINRGNIKDLLYYNLFDLLYNFFTGNWREIKKYDANLVELSLKTGVSWHLLTYIAFHSFARIGQGRFKEAEILIEKLSGIWQDYEDQNAKDYTYVLKTRLLMKSRKLYDAQIETDTWMSYLYQTERQLSLLDNRGFKAIIQIYLKDIDGARESLLEGKEFVSKQKRIPPFFSSNYLVGQLFLNLYLLERAIAFDRTLNISRIRKDTEECQKNALYNAKKYAPNRTEIYRLVGLYYWLMGRQKKALTWWNKSIQEGEKIGVRVELGRTYVEVGKRLIEEKSGFHELNGIKAEGYLSKARVLFEEMDLQWDLDELNKIAAYHIS